MSKRAWRRIGYISVALLLASVIANFVLLFKIYGCAGASFNDASKLTGLCSDDGLKAVHYATRVLRTLLVASLAGIFLGFLKAGQVKK